MQAQSSAGSARKLRTVQDQCAGALEDCPALQSARLRLQEAMPMQTGAAQSGLASLVVGCC